MISYTTSALLVFQHKYILFPIFYGGFQHYNCKLNEHSFANDADEDSGVLLIIYKYIYTMLTVCIDVDAPGPSHPWQAWRICRHRLMRNTISGCISIGGRSAGAAKAAASQASSSKTPAHLPLHRRLLFPSEPVDAPLPQIIKAQGQLVEELNERSARRISEMHVGR